MRRSSNESIRKLFTAARSVEARSLEINPLVLTKAASSSRPIAASRLMITPWRGIRS
jgi:succinyl-CoA synthetase beta subunit